jgi:integrase
VSLYQRGNIWWSRVELDGIVHQFSTKVRNKNVARTIEAAKRTELAKGRVGLRAPTLNDFATRFLNSMPKQVSPATFSFYICHLKTLLDYPALCDARLDKIDAALINDFTHWRRKQKGRGKDTVSVVTINCALRTLRRALKLAADWNVIAKAPKVKMVPHEHQREYVIPAEAVKRFETKEKGLIGKLVPFLVDTGLRRGEVVGLVWDNVNFAERYIQVAKGKTASARRKVPLTHRAEAVLKALPHCDERVWTLNGHRITVDWISHAFLRARLRLKLPDGAVLHSTRHTFCTRLGEKGADAFAIQRLAGHSSITISQRYVHPSAGRLDAAIALLD